MVPWQVAGVGLCLKPSARCDDCGGRFPVWARKGTKGNETDQKGMEGIKRERKGAKGIAASNYVRGMLGATTEQM